MRARWRPSLRTRITLTLVAVAVGVAATTAGALVWNARTIILESKQAAIYEVLRFEATAAATQMPVRPSASELQFLAESFSVPTVMLNLRTGAVGGTLPLEEVPVYLIETLDSRESVTAYERTTRYRNLEFIAGMTVRASNNAGDEIAVFGVFDMQSQQNEIDRLVNLGAVLGAFFVGAAAVIGLVIGRQLGRPLETLAAAADRIGERERDEIVDTGYPDVDAVLDSMRGSEARLDTTMRQLEQSEATARQLVADVAHELRTPLATLVAVSDILADTEAASASNRREAGEIAAKSAAHLAALTSDILEMSRFDSGKSEVVTATVDLTELWRELTEIREWGDVNVQFFGEPVVRTDALRVRLILSNLVTNALRHGEPPVDVGVWVADGRLTLAVADSGAGVPPEHADHVFHRFYKASAARANSESSGLGLAIVRENARVLGGEAWLSQEDGTVFAAWIPIGE
ncbi:HAMP domain-containing sensor histidine kinase [Leucobacter albus]|uniref:histidine kinase n=1 Tax=Leucobacter albus TaxID=272210 RepID=A0ABW3TNK3_9MICO